MKIKIILLTMSVLLGLVSWSCKDVSPLGGAGGGSKIATLSGVVVDLTTQNPVANAVVYRNVNGGIDSVRTNASGQFVFQVDLTGIDSVGVTLSIVKHGYITKSVSIVLSQDITLDIVMNVDLSTSAMVFGAVRDSSTLFPLRSSNVLYSIPGFSENLITPIDGSFNFTIDLVDRDSLPVLLTLSHTGYRTKQVTYMLHRGLSTNTGNILMAVDLGSSVGQVVGRIKDDQNNQPIFNAGVSFFSSLKNDSTTTAGDGSYSFSVNLQSLPSLSGTLKVTKNGYRSQSIPVGLTAGATTYQDVFLTRDTTTGVTHDSGTGLAHSIALVSYTSAEISVAGVGALESSTFTWEVRDSLGFPVDIDHRDTVYFSLVGIPTLGANPAYVSPSSAATNVSGRVAAIVNSGTVAGVLQFKAWLRRPSDGVMVQSEPVVITVNAGLPDQAHFSVGPVTKNFAGYDWIGRPDDISVQVGDKYSNPVRVGTAVYFNSTASVVEASGFTDPTSHATVTLFSGNPLPKLPALGAIPSLYGDGTGYLWVYAHTLGENGKNVYDSTLVLESASSDVFLDTNFVTLHVPSGGSVVVPITISDRFGNPLSAGTSFSLAADFSPPVGTNYSVLVTGLPRDPLGDYLTRGPGSTKFSIAVIDGTPGGTPADMGFTVEIRIVSNNGNLTASFHGYVGP